MLYAGSNNKGITGIKWKFANTGPSSYNIELKCENRDTQGAVGTPASTDLDLNAVHLGISFNVGFLVFQ